MVDRHAENLNDVRRCEDDARHRTCHVHPRPTASAPSPPLTGTQARNEKRTRGNHGTWNNDRHRRDDRDMRVRDHQRNDRRGHDWRDERDNWHNDDNRGDNSRLDDDCDNDNQRNDAGNN